MKKTTFSKFRNSAKAFFDAVEEKGVSVEIYRHGKLVAILVPPPGDSGRFKKGNPLTMSGVSLSAAILNERDEAR